MMNWALSGKQQESKDENSEQTPEAEDGASEEVQGINLGETEVPAHVVDKYSKEMFEELE